MADVDVKVGIQVTGDASGAKAVDEAIKQVGESAKTVAQETGEAAQKAAEASSSAASAASEAAKQASSIADSIGSAGEAASGLGDLDSAIGSLKEALSGLSPDKAKTAINSLSQAIIGLGSGDTSKGLEGLGKSLFSLASLIPLPGAAAALGIAVSACSVYWRLLQSDTAATIRDVNSLGETIDEEMLRLEGWANSQFEWSGIKNADANMRADFDLVKSTAESTTKAVEALFNVRSDSKIAALQRQVSDAESSGDAGRASSLKAQIESERAIAELVRLNIAYTEAKAEYAAQTDLARKAEDNFKALVASAESQKEKLDELRQTIIDLTGNRDAAVSGSDAHTNLVSETRGKVNYLEDESARLSQIKGYEDLAAARRIEAESMRGLLERLLNLEQQTSQVEDAESSLETARSKSNESAAQSATALSTLGLNMEALKVQLQDAATAAGPDVAQKAAEQAGLITGAVADMVEKTLQLGSDNANAVIAVGQEGASAMSAATGDLDAAKASFKKSMEEKQVPSAIQTLGEDVSGSSDAAAEAIGEGNGAIKEAVEGTATEAVSAGDEIKLGADEFRSKIGEAAINWNTAAADLAASSRSFGRMAVDISSTQLSIAQEVASLRAQTNSALSAANLALSQVRNSGR